VWAVGGTIDVAKPLGDPPGTNFTQKWSIKPDGSSAAPGEYHWDLASHPVLSFTAETFVSGIYSVPVTIYSNSQTLWLYRDITPSPVDGTATLGLVSDRDCAVPWFVSTPDNLTVYAAILARERALLKGSQNGANAKKPGTFTLKGSLTSGTAMGGSNSLQQYAGTPYGFTSGYAAMDIWPDARLASNPPPYFPLITTGTSGSTSRSIITVDSWVEK
jgi:hypothetical protein